MPEANDDEQIFKLTDTQLAAIQAMAEAGMPPSKIADALMIPLDLVEARAEWRVGRIEAIRIGQLEDELLATRKGEHRGLQAKKRAFLAALEVNGGNRTAAAAAAGVERTIHYRWLAEDPDYKVGYEHAMEQGADVLEDEVVRRAKAGVLEPIYNRAGLLIGHKLRYSDSLLLAQLAAARPERWKTRIANEHTGKDGGDIKLGLPEWLTDRFKPKQQPPDGDTTPSPASGDSTATS